MPTEKLETVQRIIRHYDLFSETVRLKKAVRKRKRTFFGVSAASGNLHKDLQINVKVKFILEQVTKAQRWNRGIALLFL